MEHLQAQGVVYKEMSKSLAAIKPKCNHSQYIEEICEHSDICTLAVYVTPCDGLIEKRHNCCFWKVQ